MIQQFHFWIYIPEEWKTGTQTDILVYQCSQQHPHNSWKIETTQVSTNKRVNKMWFIHTTDYCSPLKIQL